MAELHGESTEPQVNAMLPPSPACARLRPPTPLPLTAGPVPTYCRSHLPPFPLTSVPTYRRSHLPPIPLTDVPTYRRSHLPPLPLTPVPTYGRSGPHLLVADETVSRRPRGPCWLQEQWLLTRGEHDLAKQTVDAR